MLDLVLAFPQDNQHVTDLPYRLCSWALDEPGNVGLWVDAGGSLLGWVVMQTPFWTIDYAVHPAVSPELLPAMLAWADDRAWGLQGCSYQLPCWFVMAFADLSARARAFEAAGFACQADVGEDSWSEVMMLRPPQLPVRAQRIPQGFMVRPLAGESEVQAYVELHQAVFETRNMRVPWRQRILQHPAYRSDLDIVVQAPNGELAAFCIGWLSRNPDNRLAGQVEPLGCRAEYRRYALGRVALSEVLRRLQAAGAESISVQTDNYRNTAWALYENVGFCAARDIHIFRKDFKEA